MPISSLDGCSEQHWAEVREILEDAIRNAELEPNLVSNAEDVGIIQKRIIKNLYSNPLVVCDVSGKNPNVMFELGMRLAFDKPTIIVKDDKTSYSFDTSPIEHLEYPRDLRFTQIVEFKDSLKQKAAATLKKSETDRNYTTFLKNFGTFTVAKLDTAEVSKEDFILDELGEIRRQLGYMRSREPSSTPMLFKNDDFINKHKMHETEDPEKCQRLLRSAIPIVLEYLKANKLSDRNLRSPNLFARNALKCGALLPKCFNPDNKSCIDILKRIMQETNKDNIKHSIPLKEA